jgi:hypothetical protein
MLNKDIIQAAMGKAGISHLFRIQILSSNTFAIFAKDRKQISQKSFRSIITLNWDENENNVAGDHEWAMDGVLINFNGTEVEVQGEDAATVDLSRPDGVEALGQVIKVMVTREIQRFNELARPLLEDESQQEEGPTV